jgi:phenylalanyl-tRNA synthetase beta chain
MYFPGRAASIYYRRSASAKQDQERQDTSAVKALPSHESNTNPSGVLGTVTKALRDALPGAAGANGPQTEDICIGSLGILHPTVLSNFSILNPCSSVEIDIEPFL